MKNYYEEFMKDNNLKEESKILIKSGEHKGEKVSVSNCCMIILGATNLSKLEELEELKLENLIMRGKVEFEKIKNYEKITFVEALDMMKRNNIVYIGINNKKVKIRIVTYPVNGIFYQALFYNGNWYSISSRINYSYFKEV